MKTATAISQEIEQEYQDILKELSNPDVVSDWAKFETLNQKKTRLEQMISRLTELAETERQLSDNEKIISSREDSDLTSLALGENETLQQRQTTLKEELERLAKETEEKSRPKSVSRGAIVEIRAGVGGEEAALFAQDLFQMYSGFARLQGWAQETLDSSRTELGGLKEIVFELRPLNSINRDIFSWLNYEAGVHRVQRIPTTEKSGRVHTSTASVAVLPKVFSTEVNLNPAELKIDFFNATGPGGQNVNKRKTAVRILHLPSGLVVTSRTERSQLQNKENALSVLLARLQEAKESRSQAETSDSRRLQIGQAKRAEKIRTYNFPQDRVTDHRIKKNWHNLEKIMSGELSPIIGELQKDTA